MNDKKWKEEKILQNQDWKDKNKKYLRELQNFFDKADNIEDERLKKLVIGQMLRCDETLTTISIGMFKQYYIEGYKKATE